MNGRNCCQFPRLHEPHQQKLGTIPQPLNLSLCRHIDFRFDFLLPMFLCLAPLWGGNFSVARVVRVACTSGAFTCYYCKYIPTLPISGLASSSYQMKNSIATLIYGFLNSLQWDKNISLEKKRCVHGKSENLIIFNLISICH